MQQPAFTACARLGAGVFSSATAFSRAFHKSPVPVSLFGSLSASKEFYELYIHSTGQRAPVIILALI